MFSFSWLITHYSIVIWLFAEPWRCDEPDGHIHSDVLAFTRELIGTKHTFPLKRNKTYRPFWGGSNISRQIYGNFEGISVLFGSKPHQIMILFCTVSYPPLLRLIHPNIVKLKEAQPLPGVSVVSQSLSLETPDSFGEDWSGKAAELVVFQRDVSENSGTPKSSILMGCSIINHSFWGTPIFGNTHMGIVISQYKDPYVTPIRVINGMSAKGFGTLLSWV